MSQQAAHFSFGNSLYDKCNLDKKNQEFSIENEGVYMNKFVSMLTFVQNNFPNGFLKFSASNKTPRVRFEALSVGVSLALLENPTLSVSNIEWLDSDEFAKHTTGSSTSSPSRIKSRIEFVKNKLLSTQ